MECLFCEIIQKKRDSLIIYEDDAAVAVLDAFPRSKGHVLVLPRRHIETILDLDDADVGAFWSSVKRATELLDKSLSPKGFTIGINHGKVAGQAIEHLHVHIMPRYEGDGGGSLHSVIPNPPSVSAKEAYDEISNYKF